MLAVGSERFSLCPNTLIWGTLAALQDCRAPWRISNQLDIHHIAGFLVVMVSGVRPVKNSEIAIFAIFADNLKTRGGLCSLFFQVFECSK